MSTPLQVRILPLGDSALLVELGRAMDAVTHQRVRAAFEALDRAAIPGVLDLVPAYTSVAVHYEPLAFAAAGVPFDAARDRVLAVLSDVESTVPAPGRLIEIPVRYGGAAGPDLEHVARHTGMTARDVAALHASVEYTVSMTGFTPGFPYLSGLPPKLATPRRSSPRAAVPAGSVGIAGAQTGIYPLRSPGGWQIIGHTDVPLFRPDLNPPTLLRIGDRVRFVPVPAQ